MKTIITPRSLGITGTDADLVMGDSEFIILAEAGDRDGAYLRAFAILNPPSAPVAVREKTEFETLQLRGRDRIEGDEVVIAFNKGREVRMPKTEWISIVGRCREPHTIAAHRLA
jgi:hypothetical protein